jgi:hypothetical protein
VIHVRLTEIGTCCPEGTVEQLNRISSSPWSSCLPSLSWFGPSPAEAFPRIRRSHRAEINKAEVTSVTAVTPTANRRMLAKSFNAIIQFAKPSVVFL